MVGTFGHFLLALQVEQEQQSHLSAGDECRPRGAFHHGMDVTAEDRGNTFARECIGADTIASQGASRINIWTIASMP